MGLSGYFVTALFAGNVNIATVEIEQVALRCNNENTVEISGENIRELNNEGTSCVQQYLNPISDDVGKCTEILKTHGFLSRAQFQCDFREYSQNMINAAKECSRLFKPAKVKELLMSGMRTFDERESEKGSREFV